MQTSELDAKIAAFIETSDLDAPDDTQFEQLALEVFDYQFRTVEPYQAFCHSRGVTPENCASWRDIPPLPTEAFKELVVSTCAPEQAAYVYKTSGTSQGGKPGVVYRDEAGEALCRVAYKRTHKEYMLPDRGDILFLSLAPTPETIPTAGVGHCFQSLMEAHGTPGSRSFFGERGPDIDAFLDTLRAAQESGQPVGIYGATFSLVHVLERCEREGISFRLPAGSRVNHGSGYKGRSRELSPTEFLASISGLFDIPETHIVNVLGMTELASQYYDNTLRDAASGVSRPRHKPIHPWTRVRVVDPDTLEDLEPGRVGVLLHYDLALRSNVQVLQTEDLGMRQEDGFEILGRVVGADPRGCALTIETVLAGQ